MGTQLEIIAIMLAIAKSTTVTVMLIIVGTHSLIKE